MTDDEGPVFEPQPNPHHETVPDLGHFSLSLAVADLDASQSFYERLGFEVTGGDGDSYRMLRNPRGGATIGIFQGMFEGNILTFNPGLDPDGKVLDDFDDVRDLHARWEELGLEAAEVVGADGDGPAHVALLDPDGNPVLVDQFFPRPGSDPA